jgi:hypothetical protein
MSLVRWQVYLPVAKGFGIPERPSRDRVDYSSVVHSQMGNKMSILEMPSLDYLSIALDGVSSLLAQLCGIMACFIKAGHSTFHRQSWHCPFSTRRGQMFCVWIGRQMFKAATFCQHVWLNSSCMPLHANVCGIIFTTSNS